MALAIFIICCLLILTDRFNRTLIVLAGGTFMIWIGVIDWSSVFSKYIDWPTMVLLVSMFLMLKIVERTGVFQYIAIQLIQTTKGRPGRLFFCFSAIVTVGSALLDQVTTVMIFVPILLSITKLLQVSPLPFLITTVISANIGGMATLIGSPTNVLIGQEVEELVFNDFLYHLAPLSFILFIIVVPLLYLLFHKQLMISRKKQVELVLLEGQAYLIKSPVLLHSVAVLLLTLMAFLFQPFHGVELANVAVAGALLMMLLCAGEHAPNELFRAIDWGTLLFLIGLFMLVGGLQASGWIDRMAWTFFHLTDGQSNESMFLLLWTAGLISGFVDNVPFTAAMIPVVFETGVFGIKDMVPLWWSLAIGASLGANATLIGSSANMIVAGLALRHHVKMSFFSFLLIGFPIVLLTLLIASGYVYVRYASPFW
ncbi:ArsB/NhaD family transporter [Bacillaceae bacterium SIJ1]|uniref:ArsB/NhaD family transporter n=1 Tax=Litoribacterium kuwaitense TaxID=1398745 RepID=UPI0013EC8ADE|nr:ArsB/NhaD family transporter [Litoribacterium kuwaitense]NGP43436.1 ArsB/NhaD family transporter [Litoribacterium kuwaitense]